MNEFFDVLSSSGNVAGTLFAISITIFFGLLIGKIPFGNIKLGIAGVLFAGIILGHFGLSVDAHWSHFIKELGLMLFVYTIGLQVGPALFETLKKSGLSLNIAAFVIVTMGAIITILIYKFAHVPMEVAVGLFSGGTTNTPSLGAAESALAELFGSSHSITKMPAQGYAMAYPFGIMGIILSMVLLKLFFRVNPDKEAEKFKAENTSQSKFITVNLKVNNKLIFGHKIDELPFIKERFVSVSRIKKNNSPVELAYRDTIIEQGDIIYAIGDEERLKEFQLAVGEVSDVNLLKEKSKDISYKEIIVTRKNTLGKSLSKLKIDLKYPELKIAWITRAGVQLHPNDNLTLQFGDRIRVVGRTDSLKKISDEFGNSIKDLTHPDLLATFFGLCLGILIGIIPFSLPNIPIPLKLGLAGGPLIISLILGRLSNIGPLTFYLPTSSNLALREIGILLFLSCTGLKSGHGFFDTLINGGGLKWMLLATLITFVPLIVVGLIMALRKVNYLTICGLLGGSMTDPPALAFANSVADSDAPALAYSAVYPLVMILRILYAQLLVLLFITV